MTTRYVAMTTQNARESGWHAVLIGNPGETRDEIRKKAELQICGEQWDKAKDIYVDTELKNLKVVPFSKASQSVIDGYYEDCP